VDAVTVTPPDVRRLPALRSIPAIRVRTGYPLPEAGRTRAGEVLVGLSTLPALLAIGWLVVACPLAVVGLFRPAVVVPLAIAASAVVVPLGLALGRRTARSLRAPSWAVLATVAVAVTFAWFAAVNRSEQAVPRRDAGSYAQIGYWLMQHPKLTFAAPAWAFGPSPGDLTFASPAFYERGSTIVPQFMTGWPTALAAAGWVGGWHGILVLPALVGGCAILAVGGLAARLVGARWAPVAALLAAGAWPVLRVSQTPYSEPLALVLLAGGLCLLTDVLAAGRPGAPAQPGAAPQPVEPGAAESGAAESGAAESGAARPRARAVHRQAFVAGLVLAGGELVRLDFGVDFALIVPVLGWWWLSGRPGVRPFIAGALVGGAFGAADAAFVTRPYVMVNWSSVRLMIIGLAGMIALTVLAVVAVRRWGFPTSRRLSRLGAAAVCTVAAGLLVRPYVMVDHSQTDPRTILYTASLQDALRLPVDGTRGYAEQSLSWVSWYLGWPLLAAALAGTAVLTWRVLAGRDPHWIPALVVFAGSSVQTLVRPGITPDHPWADRRLVVEVIPGMVLLATWATAALVRRLRRSVRAPAATALILAYLVPISVATVPLATARTEEGELAAAATVCQALRPDDSVILVDSQWVPTIRGQCGLPVAQLRDPTPAAVARTVASVRAAGRTPVVASGANALEEQGLKPTEIFILHTTEDQHQLVQRPTFTQPMNIEFWLVRP